MNTCDLTPAKSQTCRSFISLSLVALVSTLVLTGCVEESEAFGEEAIDEEAIDEEEGFRSLSTGMHGNQFNPKVKSGGVVNQGLVYNIWGNPGVFWYFCGQSATSTAINFARGNSLSTGSKVTQLTWFHDRLKAREWHYNNDNPNSAGSYETRIDWLWDLMQDEKSGEFSTEDHVTGSRDGSKSWMHSQLDNGAFVVALTETNAGYGHFVAIYAIDYQPFQNGGGTVYFGDPLTGTLETRGYTAFLDDMRDASNFSQYNTFSVRKK
ncbi:MAG: hypothetical protein AAGF11_56070 [Myxococcota bacterium]